jgi:hypothetical protein
MNIFNQGIPEPSAQNSVTAIADGAVTKGTPVMVYGNGASGYKAKNTALANKTAFVGKFPGIVMATTSSGKAVDIAVGGKVAVAVSSGTVGQVVTAISASGACTTRVAASAIASGLNFYGTYSATKEIVLVG